MEFLPEQTGLLLHFLSPLRINQLLSKSLSRNGIHGLANEIGPGAGAICEVINFVCCCCFALSLYTHINARRLFRCSFLFCWVSSCLFPPTNPGGKLFALATRRQLFFPFSKPRERECVLSLGVHPSLLENAHSRNYRDMHLPSQQYAVFIYVYTGCARCQV